MSQAIQLGSVFKTVTGSTPPKSSAYFYGGSIPLVKPGELLDGPIYGAVDSLTDDGARAARILPPASVLVSCIGNLGKSGWLTKIAACNQQINAILPDPTIAVPKFMFYQTLSPSFREQLEVRSKGTTIQIVNKSSFNSILISLPPLEQQQRIVAVLDEAFTAIATATANAEKNLANAKELMSNLLLNKLTSKATSKRRLDEICVVDWGNTSLTKKAYIEDGPVLAVSAAGCDGRIGHAEHKDRIPVLSAIGARCGRMFFPEEPFTAIKNTITLTPKSDETDGKFLYYLLTSIDLPQRGAAQPFIAKGDINKFEVLIPPLENQRELVRELDDLTIHTETLVKIGEAKLTKLATLKQSLLHLAFSEQLTATNLETIAA